MYFIIIVSVFKVMYAIIIDITRICKFIIFNRFYEFIS